jgi:superfamily II DNA/RNA helicase
MTSTTFASVGAPAAVVERLAARKIVEPTPIQAATLREALAGRDVCGKAPTGSGKTIAFGIPLVTRISQGKAKRPTGLVLVPTRELAAQVAEELTKLAGPRERRITTVYGGVGMGPQMAALRRGTDIVVACPGRLADVINRGAVELRDVELVVIDEADRMADMGFLPEVRRLLDQVKPNRQTLLFSATLDGDVDVLISRYQRNPARHEVELPDDVPTNRHLFWKAEQTEKAPLTAKIVEREWPAVVFCRTKHRADRLTQQLSKMGIAAAAIHGDRSQAQRERALAAFSAGKLQALVATDVAARGIHVDDVAAVVHYDIPGDDHKSFVHRSGRTGRAGASGVVVALVQADQHKDALAIQRNLGIAPELTWPDLALLPDGGAAIGSAPPVASRPSRQPTQARQPNEARQSPPSGSTRSRSASPARRRRPSPR